METSPRQSGYCSDIIDNTHGGNSSIYVSNVTQNSRTQTNGRHSDNAHDNLYETLVNNVTTSLDKEAEENTSFISNIFQGDGADSISQGSQDEDETGDEDEDEMEDEDDDEMEDDDDNEMEDEDDHKDTSSITDYSQASISEDDCEDSGGSDEDEDDIEDDDFNDSQVPPVWYEPHTNNYDTRPRILKHIVANNRVATSGDLPTIAATNTRSIAPKIRNFAEDMLMRG